ncbi:MAG: hypothetical protein RLZZ458_144 [Planctomycetota bacterium]|jgi:prepilin-type N-terminal cleavage/methylation domain-containing protein
MYARLPKVVSPSVRHGFTLIELLVVISIIAVLMSMILPAVQQAREAGRRTQCMNNQKNLALGMLSYATARRGKLPASCYFGPGTASVDSVYAGRSWVVEILPYLDQGPLADRWNRAVPWDSPVVKSDLNNVAIGQINIGLLACPGDDSAFGKNGGLTYVVNSGYGDLVHVATRMSPQSLGELGHHPCAEPFNWLTQENTGNAEDDLINDKDWKLTLDTGVFWPSIDMPLVAGFDTSTNLNSLLDGASNTIMLTENVNAGVRSWANPDMRSHSFYLPIEVTLALAVNYGDGPTMATSYVTGPPRDSISTAWPINAGRREPEGVTPFPTSNHPGLVVMAFCDGTVRSIADSIDTGVYTRLMTPAGTRLRSYRSFLEEIPLSENSF